MGLRAGIDAIAGLVAPPACVACGAGVAGAAPLLCPRCERGLASGAPRGLEIAGADSAWAARPYDGVARQLIAALKFRQLLAAAGRAAELIATELLSELIATDSPARLIDGAVVPDPGTAFAACGRPALVPVPADPLRRAWRGFDPAERIAAELASGTGLGLAPCLRRRHGARQVGRSRRERIRSPPRVSVLGTVPRHALLVDDVVTTGATLSACANALRAAGAHRVDAVAIAASGYGPREPTGAFGAAVRRA